MKTIRVTQGNDFVVYLPLVVLNASGVEVVDTSLLTDLQVNIKRACADAITVVPTFVENYMVLSFDSTLQVGVYDCFVKGLYGGRDIELRINEFFAIVKWDKESNWKDYLVGDHVVTDTQAFIAGAFITDEEYEQLKAELAVKIAEAEAAKAEFERKAQMLDGVAQQGSNANATNTAILAAIGGGGGGASMQEIQAAIDALQVAVQGNDTTATLSALKVLINTLPTIATISDLQAVLQGNDQTATLEALKNILNAISTSMYKGVPIQQQTTNATISPNVWNVWGEINSALTITKGTDIQDIVNEYLVRFTIASGTTITSPFITFSGFSLRWNGGSEPTWAAGKTYEINIIDNIALWAEI